MGNNVFDKVCNNTSYKTYKNLEKGSFISSLALEGASAVLDLPGTCIDSSLSASAMGFLVFYMALTGSRGIDKTKDINEIKKLYNEFIKNYVKLNKDFDFNNPVQMLSMFNYLLYSGYLSRNKNFDFSEKDILDIKPLDGANIITGKGVCRHISSMFTDILNESGVDASRLCIYMPMPEITVKVLKEPKYTLEELYAIARERSLDVGTYELLMRLIKEYAIDKGLPIELEFTQTDEKNPIKKLIGNHTITFVTANGVAYYLDPTQNGCYIEDESKEGKLRDAYQFVLDTKIPSSLVFNDKDSFKRLIDGVGKIETLSMKEMGEIKRNTRRICQENTDIFEQFYRENSELYEDISQKVLKLKK